MNKAESFAMQYGYYDKGKKKACCVGYNAGYKQAEKDTIERACEWLFSHLPILLDYYDEDIHTNADRSEFIKMFRMQLEEE